MKNSQLPSWYSGPALEAILNFVESVTWENSPDYVAPEDRIAVFDNDGTLWCEKPHPVEVDFFFRRMGEVADKNQSLRSRLPWKAIVERDEKWLRSVIDNHYRGDDSGLKLMGEGVLSAFSEETVEEFEKEALEFFENVRNPKFERPYIDCVYQPMVELLRYLEDNGFTNYIATGGGRDFVRAISELVFDVPRDRVIGSSLALRYQNVGDHAEILHGPKIDIFDDGPAKPVRIWNHIGQRPILAVGNSNGDIPMLHYCDRPAGASLCLLINHDDRKREFNYSTGAEDALRMARKHGWEVVSMLRDWKTIFAFHGEKLRLVA